MNAPRVRVERVVFWIAAVVAAGVILIPRYPPPIDLPQHAGQVRFFHDWLAGDFNWGEHTELNLFTPYLVGYALGALLTTIMSAVTATKVVWSLAALGTVYTSVRLRRLVDGDPMWDWLLLPGLFGMTFTWGFFSFFVAVPIGLYTLERWIIYVRNPSARRGLLMFALFQVLFFGHVLVTAWVMTVGGLILLGRCRDRPLLKLLIEGLPLLSPLPITITWWELLKGYGPGSPTLWRVDESRVIDFLPQWLGVQIGPVVVAVGVLLLAVPFISGARFARDPTKLAALVVTMAIVVFVPYHLFGNAFTYNRFYTFLGTGLVMAFASGRAASRFHRLRWLVPIMSIAWTLLFVARMIVFRAESEDFVQIVERMEPNRHVVAMVQQPMSDGADLRLAYLHFPSWYQAETGGFAEFSFVSLAPCVVRFKRGYQSTIRPGFEFKPYDFDVTQFDYILVRGGSKDRPLSSPAIRELAHEGSWWLYAPLR